VKKGPAILMFCAYVLYVVYQFAAAFAPPSANFAICFPSINVCI